MANISIQDEKDLRAGLAAFLDTFPILGQIHTRRRRIQNRLDFVKKFGVTVPAAGPDKIVRFCEVEFLQIEDSPDEGDDDCPLAIVTYGLHLFHEFFDGTDDANSQDDFISAILTVRNGILNNREIDANVYEGHLDPLTMPEFAGFGNDSFTDCVGHIADLTLKVNFYDE